MLVRQRPGTAKGVIFMTLEDETGVANIIVWPKAFERLRAIVIGARFVAVTGKLQNESGVIHLIAERMEDLTPMLGLLSEAGGPIETHGARRRSQPAANDDGAEAPGQPLRPDAPARRPAPAGRSRLRSHRSEARDAGGTEFSVIRRPTLAVALRPNCRHHRTGSFMLCSRQNDYPGRTMRTDLATLKRLIIETARKSPVGENVEGVDLESDRDDDGVDFLRVMICLKSIDEADYPALADLIDAIEDVVGEIDDDIPASDSPMLPDAELRCGLLEAAGLLLSRRGGQRGRLPRARRPSAAFRPPITRSFTSCSMKSGRELSGLRQQLARASAHPREDNFAQGTEDHARQVARERSRQFC